METETICIISDVHHRIERVDAAIAVAGADRVVFLGDFFDDFHDSFLDAQRTARWLRARLDEHPEDTFLFGNHDLPYAFGGAVLYPCPGWTPKKHHAVNRELEERHWRRFRLHAWEQGWLLSHAGIARWLFPFAESDPAEHKRHVVDERCRLALERSWRGEQDLLLSVAGHARGGRAEKGGIVWQCWSEFEPVPGINQIVGHTPDKEVRRRSKPLQEQMLSGRVYVRTENKEAGFISDNACLDTNSQNYGLLENGKLTTHPTPGTDAFHQTCVATSTKTP